MAPEPAGDQPVLPVGATRCVCSPDPTAGDVAELHLEQDVIATTARTVRGAVREWASGAGLETETVEAVVLAVEEAVANAIDHAYPPDPQEAHDTDAAGSAGRRVVVSAASRPCGGGVAVSVVDNGTWRPAPLDPGHRGRGVRVIGAISQRSTITPGEHGTTVHMCWAHR